jgi:glycogen debranching enzyme
VTGTFHLPDTLSPQPAFPVRPGAAAPWVVPTVDGDHRLAGLVRHGLAELDALRLADPLSPDGGPEDQFIAAGCPWYLTLFGRDSIWAARMMLPLGTELARGTLRALARRQGEAKDDFREEAPGRILHELRPAESLHNNGMVLPAVYYGSMDATPLFVVLLVEAWRWGLPEAEVRALLPHAEAAMRWLRDHGDPDHDGLLEYQSPREDALTHQGWKDSEESVLDADGGRASPPIALCEVQGYAYQAAVGFADLLDHLGREEDAKGWRGWAATLRERFHNAFWLPSTGPADPAPRYVAIALGRDKSPVTGPASNMGHLLGTGILNAEESRDVAAWLAAPGLNSGWGLRSRSSAVTGFNPLSYHGGAVWSHDTAIAVSGLAAEGHRDEATRLLSGLLDAASRFGYRMPELYSGADRTRSSAEPLPYPPACRPQGWAAAAGVCLLASRLGLRPDAARRVLEVRPTPVDLPGRLQVSGLWLGGLPFDVSVDPGAHAEVTGSALQGWRVVRLP